LENIGYLLLNVVKFYNYRKYFCITCLIFAVILIIFPISFAAAAWSPGGIIGSGASFSGLGASSWGPNRVDVFAVISPNVVHRWYDPNNLPPGWSTTTDGRPLWEPLDAPPGGAYGSPAAATWGPNRLDVIVGARNEDIGIWHRWYDPNNLPPGWSTVAGTSAEPYWEPVGTPPGGLAGSPAVTTWGTNRLDIFVKNEDGQIYHRWYDPNNLPPGWSTVAGTSAEPYWEPLGAPPGGVDGSPAAATWGTNRLDIFVLARNDDLNIWHKFFQGSRWSDWVPHRITTCNTVSPAAASWGPGRVDVIMPATNCLLPPRASGMTNHNWIENYDEGSFRGFRQNWVMLPPLALSSWGPNRLDFFGLGRDGEIRHLYCQSDCIP
jgi:hypothetical protein